MLISFTTEEQSLDELFKVTYSNINSLFHNSYALDSRIILTKKNDYVHEINVMLISKFSNTAKIFVEIDETIEPNDQSQFEDYLHTIKPANFPPYKLTLKENCPVMLLRNLNPSEGLCNGTQLMCCNFKTHVTSANIASGDFQINMYLFLAYHYQLQQMRTFRFLSREHSFQYDYVLL